MYTFLAVVGVSTIVFVLLGVSGALATGVFKASMVAVGDRLSALADFLGSKTYSSTKGGSWLFSKPDSLLN